jgi:hypothetical protein
LGSHLRHDQPLLPFRRIELYVSSSNSHGELASVAAITIATGQTIGNASLEMSTIDGPSVHSTTAPITGKMIVAGDGNAYVPYLDTNETYDAHGQRIRSTLNATPYDFIYRGGQAVDEVTASSWIWGHAGGTHGIYAQAITPKKLEAQGTFLRSLLAQGEANGLVQ